MEVLSIILEVTMVLLQLIVLAMGMMSFYPIPFLGGNGGKVSLALGPTDVHFWG